MRTEFVRDTLTRLLDQATLRPSDAVLAVCAADAERALFDGMGFTNVTISNLDARITDGEDRFAPFAWSCQDAQALTFPDQAFDFVFVADGLHHCASPHRALLEMYRVARKGIIVIESRDNALMRLANRLGLSPRYELEGVARHGNRYGGVDNTPIPNYIYRWTEREFEKTLASYDPTGRIGYHYFYGLNLPHLHAAQRKNPLKRIAVKALAPAAWLLTTLAPRQGNSFAMVALKPTTPEATWPWLNRRNGHVELNDAYVRERFKVEE